jgi:hypothetical protein
LAAGASYLKIQRITFVAPTIEEGSSSLQPEYFELLALLLMLLL